MATEEALLKADEALRKEADYGLSAKQRRSFVDRIIEFVIFDTAEQADDAGVTPETADTKPMWGLAWRARAGAWIVRHRCTLQNALS